MYQRRPKPDFLLLTVALFGLGTLITATVQMAFS
jgi:hypothetical protein